MSDDYDKHRKLAGDVLRKVKPRISPRPTTRKPQKLLNVLTAVAFGIGALFGISVCVMLTFVPGLMEKFPNTTNFIALITAAIISGIVGVVVQKKYF